MVIELDFKFKNDNTEIIFGKPKKKIDSEQEIINIKYPLLKKIFKKIYRFFSNRRNR